MTLCAITTVLDRVGSSSPDSPIAVFYLGNNELVEAVFAKTIHTRNRIESGDPNFIGYFDCTIARKELAKILRKELERRQDGNEWKKLGMRMVGDL